MADADARIAAAVRAIPDTSRTVYVDAISGDDTADGEVNTPLATLEAALRRAVHGGVHTINLLSDVTMTERIELRPTRCVIQGKSADGAFVKRRVAFSSSVATNRSDGWMAGVTHRNDGVLWLRSLNVELPVVGNDVTYSAVISHWAGGTTVLYDSEVTAQAGVNSHLIGPAQGLCVVHLAGTTLAAEVGPGTGVMFANIAAGTDPNSNWKIITNITQN